MKTSSAENFRNSNSRKLVADVHQTLKLIKSSAGDDPLRPIASKMLNMLIDVYHWHPQWSSRLAMESNFNQWRPGRLMGQPADIVMIRDDFMFAFKAAQDGTAAAHSSGSALMRPIRSNRWLCPFTTSLFKIGKEWRKQKFRTFGNLINLFTEPSLGSAS